MFRLKRLYSTKARYTNLLLTLIGIFFLSPFTVFYPYMLILLSAGFLLSNFFVIYSLNLPRRYVYLLRGMVFFSFILDSCHFVLPQVEAQQFALLTYIFYCLFMMLAILVIGSRIFREPRVDIHIINGGICLFLILGMLWFMFYQLILFFDPAAFGDALVNRHQIFYFSFTTLTTLGYGDFTPKNEFAMTLANAEAIIGMLYPAISIARLVALYAPATSGGDRSPPEP